MEIQIIHGNNAKDLVNPFYERHNKHTRARESDVFFIIQDQGCVLASVRYCIEEQTNLLRGMLVDENCRQKGLGKFLLKGFEKYLIENGVLNTYCIPHSYLEKFYGTIGFKKIDSNDGPLFLFQRVKEYNSSANRDVILMQRNF